jgi:hypothetical protein
MADALATVDDRTPRRVTPRTVALGFAAGVLSVLVFHQGTVWLLHMAGVLPAGPFGVRPIPPFGVPQIVNQCFWGGLWGILIAALLRRWGTRAPDLLFGAVFGAVALNIVNWIVLPAIKGLPYFAGGAPARLLAAALINGAFGWGVALILRAFRDRAAATATA